MNNRITMVADAIRDISMHIERLGLVNVNRIAIIKLQAARTLLVRQLTADSETPDEQ